MNRIVVNSEEVKNLLNRIKSNCEAIGTATSIIQNEMAEIDDAIYKSTAKNILNVSISNICTELTKARTVVENLKTIANNHVEDMIDCDEELCKKIQNV